MWACMYVHTAWASVLLFGMKGNTRALMSGTAIVQSRFFVVIIIFMQFDKNGECRKSAEE